MSHSGDPKSFVEDQGSASLASLPSVRFDWLVEALPAGPWPAHLRQALCDAMKTVGWDAVQKGEFGPLAAFYRDFTSIFPRFLVDRSDMDRAADLYTLIHIMLWRHTQRLPDLKRFNVDVVRPFAAFCARHSVRETLAPPSRETPRIAYLSETSDLAGPNAVARITVSLMLGQHQVRAQADWPMLYCINKPVPALWAFAQEHGLNVRDLARPTPSETADAIVAQLKIDGIDILVADSNCAVATMVMMRRPAHVQAFHENGFGVWAIPELDLALLGITQPSADLYEPGVEMVQTPRNTAFVFQKMARPATDVAAIREAMRRESGIEEPSVVYGVYGRMAKITPAYMRQVEAILQRDPRAIFFAGGTGRISPLTDCAERSPVGDRILIFNDFIDGHLVSECIDLFLDTHPFPGGMSCIEVQARGVPVVWRASDSADERMNLIAEQRDPHLRARDAADYVDLASALADPDLRARHAVVAREIARRFGDMREQAIQVEAHLRAAWDKARETKRIAA